MATIDIPVKQIFKPTYDARAGAAARANRPIHIPELPPGSPVELAAKLAELTKLRSDARATRAAVVELDGRPAELTASRADAQAFADATRAGKADPGAQAEQKRLTALGDARRRSAGLARAIGDTEAELLTMIDANRDAWTVAAEPAIAKAEKAELQARADLAAAKAVVDEQLLFLAWLAEPKVRPHLPAD